MRFALTKAAALAVALLMLAAGGAARPADAQNRLCHAELAAGEEVNTLSALAFANPDPAALERAALAVAASLYRQCQEGQVLVTGVAAVRLFFCDFRFAMPNANTCILVARRR
jgi:hypothetical protein